MFTSRYVLNYSIINKEHCISLSYNQNTINILLLLIITCDTQHVTFLLTPFLSEVEYGFVKFKHKPCVRLN